MARLLAVVAFLALALVARADTFEIADAHLRFAVPGEFRKLQRKEIDALYAVGRGPTLVVANADRTVSLSYDLKFHHLGGLTPAQALPHFVKVFEQMVPGISWKAKAVANQANQEWIRLEFVSRSRGIDYRNVMWVAQRDGRLLVLNWVVLESLWSAAEPLVSSMVRSVEWYVDAPAPVPAGPAPGTRSARP
jgi:hypothetical protein